MGRTDSCRPASQRQTLPWDCHVEEQAVPLRKGRERGGMLSYQRLLHKMTWGELETLTTGLIMIHWHLSSSSLKPELLSVTQPTKLFKHFTCLWVLRLFTYLQSHLVHSPTWRLCSSHTGDSLFFAWNALSVFALVCLTMCTSYLFLVAVSY